MLAVGGEMTSVRNSTTSVSEAGGCRGESAQKTHAFKLNFHFSKELMKVLDLTQAFLKMINLAAP